MNDKKWYQKRRQKQMQDRSEDTNRLIEETDDLRGWDTSPVEGGDTKRIRLKREVGLVGGIAIIGGSIIGSGIFFAPQGILLEAKSVGMSMVVWVVCGIVSSLGALCFAELGSVVPQTGGIYTYILLAYGDLPAFLTSWAGNTIMKPSGGAVLSLTFGYYVADYVTPGSCPPPEEAVRLFAILALMTTVFVNCLSVKITNSLQILFTTTKVLVLIMIIITGLIKIIQGQNEYLDPSVSFQSSSVNAFGYALAMYQGFWAFGGWDILNNLSEEIVNPERNIPLAICIAMPFITVIYLMTNIAYFTLLSPEEVLASSAVAVTFAERTYGPMAWVIPFGVCLSTFGSLLGSLLADPRTSLAAGREGHMLMLTSMVSVRWNTPAPAVVLQGITVAVLIAIGRINAIFKFTGAVTWTLYGASFIAVFILRHKLPNQSKHFKVPTLVPIVATLFSIFMIVAPIIAEPSLEYLYALLLMGIGLAFHTIFIRYRYHPTCMDSVTAFIQKLFLAGPSSFEPTKNDY